MRPLLPPLPLLILGASARAAAVSARRAGCVPAAGDLFGDRDLTAIAAWTLASPYPLGLEAAALRLPESPWIYTGGLENHPDLVDRIANRRPLLGNPGCVLRAVRDPLRLAGCLAEHGLVGPECRLAAPPRPAGGRWLVKPLRSCGGHGIRWATPASPLSDGASGPSIFYYQRFIPGPTYSAVYVAAGGRATLLGTTRQLTGLAWTGAPPFAYCGSIGPACLPHKVNLTLRRIGGALAGAFGLVGLFGIDAVVVGSDVYALEVNPRYTASVEVLERAAGRPLLVDHLRACREGWLPPEDSQFPGRCCGKAVVYARRTLSVSPRFSELLDRLNAGRDWPPLADLPCTETQIAAGRPLITLRAESASERAVRQALRRLARVLQRGLEMEP